MEDTRPDLNALNKAKPDDLITYFEDTWIKEKCHQRQYKRHPLIIVNLIIALHVRRRQKVVCRHVIRVGYPAYVVDISDHGARELSGRPACDRRADELRRAH